MVFSVWPRARLTPAAIVTGGLLLAFGVLTAASITWSVSAEQSFLELNRVTLYLGIFAIAVVAGTRRNVRSVAEGMALGLVAVALLALTTRLLPEVVATGDLNRHLPGVQSRLSHPVDYWNGLGILVALALPLLLGVAVGDRRALMRGLALAPVPAIVATIYLTSSRGAAAAAIAGAVLFLVLTGRRLTTLGALVVGGGGAAAAIGVLLARPELVDGPLGSALARSQGESAAVLIALACVATGAAWTVAARLLPAERSGAARKLGTALTVLTLAGACAGVAAADPGERFEQFKRPPGGSDIPERNYTQAHLLSGGGSGRWQFWEAAVREFETRPAVGRGAGSYEAWWAEHGRISYFIRDAHSLYFEVLGELGYVGLGLIVLVLGSGLVVAVGRLRRVAPEARTVIAALGGTLGAFVLAAGIDWMWELTIVAVVAIACLGLLTGPATAPAQSRERGRATRGAGRLALAARVAVVAVAIGAIGAQALPLLSSSHVRESQAAVTANDGSRALEHALAARSIQPWAASSHLQVALVQEQLGDLRAARAAIAEAIDRDRSDWRLWLTAARLEVKAGRIAVARRSLARARTLNPRSPLFAR